MKPRGVPSSWIIISTTYATEKNQPSRQRERDNALAYETAADGWYKNRDAAVEITAEERLYDRNR
jgi:hypothetical protein